MQPANSCLRPAFTAQLAARLQAGQALILTSPHGQGRRRTLRDLRGSLAGSLRILHANMRDCPASLPPLLASLTQQAGLPTTESLASLLAQLAADPQPTLIILHNFDELQPNDSRDFDARFFAALNSIGEHEGLSLLCICERRPDGLPAIETLPLPPLAKAEIAAELVQRGLQPDEAAQCADHIICDPAPYSAIEAIAPEKMP